MYWSIYFQLTQEKCAGLNSLTILPRQKVLKYEPKLKSKILHEYLSVSALSPTLEHAKHTWKFKVVNMV